MCNLYSLTKGQQAIRELARAMSDRTGNLPLMPGIYPDNRAPVVRTRSDGLRSTLIKRGLIRKEKDGSAMRYYPV